MPEVIPYALRHSSIVRGLRKGLPIQQVAKLHNTSVKTIERLLLAALAMQRSITAPYGPSQ